MELFVLIATTDVPHILQVYQEETPYSVVKNAVRSWARTAHLIKETESLRSLKEPNKPGLWLEQTSFGWLLKRIAAPVAGWIYSSASTSTILAEIRLIRVANSTLGESFAEQRQALLNAEQQLQLSYAANEEQKLLCQQLRNEIERDEKEQMLSLLVELEKCKQGSAMDLERLNNLNISLADMLYTAQVLLWTLKQTEAKLETANQQLLMSEAIYDVELQQERCVSADLRLCLEQTKEKLAHQLEIVQPELCYKHEIELMSAQTALCNLQTEYSLAKERFQAQLVEQSKEAEKVQHELASHNLEQAFDVCLLQSAQSNLRSQLEQKDKQYCAALDQLSASKDQVSYERQLVAQEQEVNSKLNEMCEELCAEVHRLRAALENSEAESTDAWVCRKLMAENERLQSYAQELISGHNQECDDLRAFIAQQSKENSERIAALERRLATQAQTIKNFQEEKAQLLDSEKQLQEQCDQLKWSNNLYADQAKQHQHSEDAERLDHELAILRSKLEAAEQREREMEENLEQTLRMSEERRTMLNSREKESDIYFEQWQNCCRALEEKAQELDRLATAQQETASKVSEKQKRIGELEGLVRKLEADLAYIVDLHWGRSLQ